MKRLIIASQVSIIWNSCFKMKIPGLPWWCWRICLETNKPKKINFRTSALSFRWWRNVEGGNFPTCIIFHTCERDHSCYSSSVKRLLFQSKVGMIICICVYVCLHMHLWWELWGGNEVQLTTFFCFLMSCPE